MCDEVCKELRGWCRSFTRTERLLTTLEAVLLVVFIGLLAFLILHLSVCPDNLHNDVTTPKSKTEPTTGKYDGNEYNTTNDYKSTADDENNTTDIDGNRIYDIPDDDRNYENDSTTMDNKDTDNTTAWGSTLRPFAPTTWSAPEQTTEKSNNNKSKPTSTGKSMKTKTSIQCTWNPSEKTSPATRYYDFGGPEPTEQSKTANETSTKKGQIFSDFPKFSEESDGEEPSDTNQGIILALVKVLSKKVTFGCSVTVVARHWGLTAASCIEAIEEVDSLDSYVMMAQIGVVKDGYPIADIRVHPRYKAGTAQYDLAALRARSALLPAHAQFPPLARPIDEAFITIGETLTILGFGRFRTMDPSPMERRLRQTRVVRLPPTACLPPTEEEEGEGETWALRHLWGGAPAGEGGGEVVRGAVCAGVRWARGSPCHYCGGTPLLMGIGEGGAGRERLLGVMAAAPACGANCEPAFYVNMADVADWVMAVMQS